MKIGMTFDLRSEYLAQGFSEEETAEFDRESTISAIEGALVDLRHQTERIGNARSLMQALASGKRWDLVFNIAEGMRGFGRESLIPALLDEYGIPYVFSDPLTMGVTLHKATAKCLVRHAGLATPDYQVIEELKDLERFNLEYPVFAKPVAEGTGKGVTSRSICRNFEQLYEACKSLLEKYRQPVLLEDYLPGREFTVGIVGTGSTARCVGTMEIVLNSKADSEVYTYDNKEFCEDRVEYVRSTGPTAADAEKLALQAYRILCIKDAGRVDIRQDAQGNMMFLEVNPLAGLHPEHSDLPIICTRNNIAYRDLIDMILCSGLQRTYPATCETQVN